MAMAMSSAWLPVEHPAVVFGTELLNHVGGHAFHAGHSLHGSMKSLFNEDLFDQREVLGPGSVLEEL